MSRHLWELRIDSRGQQYVVEKEIELLLPEMVHRYNDALRDIYNLREDIKLLQKDERRLKRHCILQRRIDHEQEQEWFTAKCSVCGSASEETRWPMIAEREILEHLETAHELSPAA